MPIVTVNVSQIQAPTSNLLQKRGFFISQGGTTLGVGSAPALITQPADLTAVQFGGTAPSATPTYGSGVLTFTTPTPHGQSVGSAFPVLIQGVVPAGYNGAYTATSTGTSSFTVPATSLGAVTTPGTYWLENSLAYEVVEMVTTYFSQGSGQAAYVLELGAGSSAAGVAALTSYLTANAGGAGMPYLVCVPREWDAEATFLPLIAAYSNTSSKLYFFTTTTIGTYSRYLAANKAVFAVIEAPGVQAPEFSAAAFMYRFLNYAPAAANRVTPAAYAFLYGVTPYPTAGNAALLATLKAASVNVVGTGAEGGISTACSFYGTTIDGRDFTYWYSVDYAEINIDLQVSNAVINGSNNPLAPLYYSQAGIDMLLGVMTSFARSMVTFGLATGTPVVTATGFAAYCQANPSDYKAGIYRGLAMTYTPARGFTGITINVNVTDFIAS